MIWNQKSQLAGISSDLRFGIVGDKVMTWDRGKKKTKLKIKIETIKSRDLNLFGSLINNPVMLITSSKQQCWLQLNFLYFLLIFNDSLVT